MYFSLYIGDNPLPIRHNFIPLEDNRSQELANTPIIIISGDRPYYLIKSLENLIKTPGFIIENTFIDTDSNTAEVEAIAFLFNIKIIIRKPRCKRNCKIANVYSFLIAL